MNTSSRDQMAREQASERRAGPGDQAPALPATNLNTAPEVRLTEDGHVAVRYDAQDWMVLHAELGEVTLLDASEMPAEAVRLVPASAEAGGGAMIRTARVAGLSMLPRRPSFGQRLTNRQLEVLAAAASGRTYRQIGRRLYITEATVSTQLDRVRRKLGVPTTAAAVDRAVQLGLLAKPQRPEPHGPGCARREVPPRSLTFPVDQRRHRLSGVIT